MADQKKAAPSSVQYGSEQSVGAGRGLGRDEVRTADGDIAPEKSGRNATGARDAFVSTEVADEAARRGKVAKRTTS